MGTYKYKTHNTTDSFPYTHDLENSALKKMNSHQIHYLPPVKPSAIALGAIFSHAANMAVLAPILGDTYHRAKAADSKEEFIKSREAASAAALYGSTLVGSGAQSY